jgi:hypothetical protein
LLILPFFLFGLAWQHKVWSKRLGILAVYGLAILVIAIIVMAPYWPGLDNWAVLHAGSGAGRSLFALLVLTMMPQMGTSTAFDIASTLLYLILGGVYLWGVWRVLRPHKRKMSTPEEALETPILVSFYVFFWYVLLVASVFHAWYLLWFLSLAALLIPAIRPTSGAAVFSLAALLVIPYYETIRVWMPLLNQKHWLGHLIGVGLLLIPVLLSLWKPVQLLPGEAPSQGRGES